MQNAECKMQNDSAFHFCIPHSAFCISALSSLKRRRLSLPSINGSDTAWLLISTALVLMMTPALGFFYGGMGRAKNALNTPMISFSALRGVGLGAQGTIPHLLFFAYQGTFAIITAALISGAIVERMRFGPYIAFITLWSLLVYAPIAHWVW